jgi:hypothetical protein
MPKTPYLIAAAMIAALCLGAGIQPGLAATAAEAEVKAEAAADPEANTNAEATADPEAAAAADPSPEPKQKKEKKPGRWAEGGRPPGRVVSDRWGFYVGGFIADASTEAAIGSGKLLGATIRIEDNLGLKEDSSTFRAEGFYRFNPRHGLDIGIWALSRDGERVIDEEFDFQGKIIQVGANIATEFDTSYFRLAYKYSMVNTDRAEAGITAGLSTYNFRLGLKGDISIADPNGVLQENFDSLTETILAPVPTIGFFLNYAMRPRLLFKLKADFLNIEIGDIEGRVLDTTFGVEWYFTRHVGVGLLSNSTSIEVADRSENPWSVDYRQRGWVGYFTFVFGSNIDKADRQKQ